VEKYWKEFLFFFGECASGIFAFATAHALELRILVTVQHSRFQG
jgi:hypothetical protein